MSQLLWHYILGPRFQLVVDSGVILPDADVEDGHKPCVWFGGDDLWEKRSGDVLSDLPTDKLYRFNRDETAQRERGLGRIGVISATVRYDWMDYNQFIGRSRFDSIHPPRSSMKFILCRSFSPAAVFSDDWRAVQIWQDGTWIDVPFEKHDC